MNCFNGEEFLVEAIDSVFNQTYTDWEIIFFDNASTDGSREIAKSYGSKLKYYTKFPAVFAAGVLVNVNVVAEPVPLNSLI